MGREWGGERGIKEIWGALRLGEIWERKCRGEVAKGNGNSRGERGRADGKSMGMGTRNWELWDLG